MSNVERHINRIVAGNFCDARPINFTRSFKV